MSELDEQIAVRREKRERLRTAGVDAYPARCVYDLEPADVRRRWDGASAAELDATAVRLRVPGRVRALRDQGKLAFLDLADGREKIQLLVRKERLDEPGRALLEQLDLGDYVLGEGPLGRSRTGELSLFAERLTLLAKALRPLPEKWHGLADLEVRHRQRYLDLVANPESRRTFEIRARLVAGIRRFLDARGFLEVETPMMQPLPGGAAARPFVTHHNALDLQLYLRVAPELYLKRLLVGGLHRVYEINRNFRNEGISTQHNPEFTMLEFYQAYSDYRQLMDLTEELIVSLVDDFQDVSVSSRDDNQSKGSAVEGKSPRREGGVGASDAPGAGGAGARGGGASRESRAGRERKLSYRGKTLDFSPPWPRWTMAEALTELAGVPAEQTDSVEGLLSVCRARGLEVPPEARRGAAGLPSYGLFLPFVFEAMCEEKLSGPVFIVDHPVEISPLAKQKPEDPRFTERFELYLGGMEIANAFSELNDPDVQAERFRQQLAAREAGDLEAHRFDHDFVRALEHGMPPAGGEGIGIDRLTMVFADQASIRDVILFPLLRPEGSTREAPPASEA